MPNRDFKEYQALLDCAFPRVQEVFPECLAEAKKVFSKEGMTNYLQAAHKICYLGRGADPVLTFLQEIPYVASILGEQAITKVLDFVVVMTKTPNGKAINPFLQSLPSVARYLHDEILCTEYLNIIKYLMDETSVSIHGIHVTHPSPSLPIFLEKVPHLLSQLSIQGIRNFVEYGVKNFATHPGRQKEFFNLETADSQAVLKRERHGVLLFYAENRLDKYIKALWDKTAFFHPFAVDSARPDKVLPFYNFDEEGLFLPDVLDDIPEKNLQGLDHYIAIVSHMMAHQEWSERIFADNFAPFQRFAVETLEDSRVEYLAIQRYPGLRKLWLALHPKPKEGDCDHENISCIRHRLAILSRAILDPNHGYENKFILEFREKFFELMESGEHSTQKMAKLAVSFVAKTRQYADFSPHVAFHDTLVEYRDDNRHMWMFHEEDDEADDASGEAPKEQEQEEDPTFGIPYHYDEWDYSSKTYRPDWVTLYESLYPSADASYIDKLLEKHKDLAKKIKQIIDLLKPQNYVRIRYQEEGSDLDLDVAIRSLIDYKSGHTPDPRINMSHKHDGRDLAVMLLLDLSESLNDKVPNSDQTILDLSQEAITLLGWAIDKLGDKFAIAGFHSNTRHEVRYYPIKGYSENWDDKVKARLSALKAGWSTRMGAAMRHAGHYLSHQQADKKLLLVLTDGEPADIDSYDENLLIEDAHMATVELKHKGIYPYCINLDAKADDYVSKIFGNHYTIIDNIKRLPEKLPKLFISLTG